MQGFRFDRACRSGPLRELQHHAPRSRALLLDLRDPQRPDLARIRHVRSSAGLQVDAIDLEQAHAAHAARWLHRHGAHEIRLGLELRVGDPDGAHVVRLRDQARQLALEVLAVERVIEQPLVWCGTIAHRRCVAVWKRMWRWRRSQSRRSVTFSPTAGIASWPGAGTWRISPGASPFTRSAIAVNHPPARPVLSASPARTP